MLKVLIVDDEGLERKALSKIITSSSGNIVVVGEAPNGRKAIEMAREHKPDIILMDIKMPGVDGVEAVKEIKKMEPRTRFIMVSAFNTFAYAKEVMQQGVKEYILKPSSKEDILASIKRVSDEVLEERKELEEQKNLKRNLDRAVSIAQKEWVSSLLMNQVQDISFDEWGQLLGVEIKSGYIMQFRLQPKDGLELLVNEKQMWHKWLKKELKSIVKNHEMIIGPLTDDQVPALFLCKKSSEKLYFKKTAQALAETIITCFQKEKFNGFLRIGIGFAYYQAHELNQSFQEAIMALKQLENTPNRKYLFCEKHTGELTVTSIHEVEKRLLDAIRQGERNQALIMFDLYISDLKLNKNFSAMFLKKSFDELFILISRMLHDFDITYQRVSSIDETDEMNKIIEKEKTNILFVVQNVQVWRNDQAKGMLYKAKEYIEEHFQDSLSLELVAEYVGLSPFYFSKLFKDRFGITFVDYLTEIRIRQAKIDLVDQGRSLKEICFSIGYKDPNYFSRVFKKHTGLSPSEFRRTTVS